MTVDFVLTWVNEADEEWQQSRQRAVSNLTGADLVSFDSRFRDWGFLRYWFRSIHQYAPWVNTVHVVHSGALPQWIDVDHPKLKTWKSADLIGLGYPTFNSHSVESRLHAIPGLAEQFVYFNDDTILTKSINPSHFFRNGLPRLLNVPVIHTQDIEHNHAALHATGLINEHFTKKQFLKNAAKSIAPTLTSKNFWRLQLFFASSGIGPILNSHLAHPYLRSVVQQAFDAAPHDIEEARHAVFRTREEVSPLYYARMWHLASGNYTACRYSDLGAYVAIRNDSIAQVERAIEHARGPQLCLNDKFAGDASDAIERVGAALARKFPHVSPYER